MPASTRDSPTTDTRQTRMDWRAQEMLLLSQVMRGVGRSVDSQAVLREMLHLMSELLGLNRGRIVLADAAVPRGQPVASRIRHAYGLTRDEVARGAYGPGEGVTGRVLGTGQPALEHCDLEIARPGLWMLVGSNGSGKSTLLRLISGLLQADGGTVDTLLKPALVFQNPDHQLLLPSCGSDLQLGLPAGLPEAERTARMERALQQVGVQVNLSVPHKSGAAAEWDPRARTLRIQPTVVSKRFWLATG
jgi:hypothetical protein